MNLPNILTLGRIIAIPVIITLALSNSEVLRWVALMLFVLAAITDFLDGYLARIMKLVSPLGRMLDPIADKLLVGALLVALAWDQTLSTIDLIPAIIILMREIFISGLREYLAGQNAVVHVSKLAKYKTTLQLVALGICLAETLISGLGTISDILLWGAGALTAWTGWSYWQGAQEFMRNAPEEADH